MGTLIVAPSQLRWLKLAEVIQAMVWTLAVWLQSAMLVTILIVFSPQHAWSESQVSSHRGICEWKLLTGLCLEGPLTSGSLTNFSPAAQLPSGTAHPFMCGGHEWPHNLLSSLRPSCLEVQMV